MKLFRLSIRQKIISIILTVTIFSIIAGFTIEIIQNKKSSTNDLKNSTLLDAKLISDYLNPTLLFNDRAGAEQILLKLTNIPDIIYCAAYQTDGKLFVEYTAPALSQKPLPVTSDSLSFEKAGQIKITTPILSNNERLGTVILIASTEIISTKTRQHIKLISIILAISILFALLLAILLERIISGPIVNLATTTRKIQRTFDYSLRVKKKFPDEIGELYDGFNEMLHSIELKTKERDIAQDKLSQERELLEKRVHERTRELSIAKEKAEESDKLKSAFLANMSHEIRTPLNAILGCSSLMCDKLVSGEELEDIKKMMEVGASDLLKLIDDILDLSRIEANQITLKLQDVSVRQLSEELFGTFKQSLLSGKTDSAVTPVHIVPEGRQDYIITTDPLRLKQIILNILNNAIKFTSQGSVEYCYFPNEDQTKIIFTIKDTGIGIARDKQDKIFERFTKVADDKTKLYKGTGLGLSIAFKLTQLLKGTIRVESELNVGTSFYLTFPLNCVVADSSFKAREAVSGDNSLSFLSGKVILITEDVEFNFRYLNLVLNRNHDVKILWAKNGIEAINSCRENPDISVVLMDIQLPEMNGFDATRIIKAERSNLPVIAQTACATSSDIENCYKAGCVDVLVKPINITTLLQSLKNHLS